MTATTAAPERFDIGRVFSGGFEIARRRPLTLIVVTAIFGYLPAALTLWLTTLMPQPVPGGGLAALGPILQRLGLTELIAVLMGGFSWILQGSVAAAALSDYGAQPLSVGQALARAAPRMPVVYLGGVLATLGIILGAIALIVPGILLGLAWSVGGIVATVENAGFKSFGRSAELTRGNRLSLFIIFLVYAIVGVVVGVVSGFAARALGGVALTSTTPPLWLTLTVQPLASSVVAIFSTATLVAAYVELRGVKDGLAASGLASLFD